jgi:hypothetical protein
MFASGAGSPNGAHSPPTCRYSARSISPSEVTRTSTVSGNPDGSVTLPPKPAGELFVSRRNSITRLPPAETRSALA